MIPVTIIISVIESDTGAALGSFGADFDFPSVPRAGETIFVAGEAQRVQDVAWSQSEQGESTGGFDLIELFLSTRRVSPESPDTLVTLKDAGFDPLDHEGNVLTWEEYAQAELDADQPSDDINTTS